MPDRALGQTDQFPLGEKGGVSTQMLTFLRFTATATAFVACLLLIALWVRSEAWEDVVMARIYRTHSGIQVLRLYSWQGRIRLLIADAPFPQFSKLLNAPTVTWQ